MASGLTVLDLALLHDSTGALVGAMGANGKEYLFPTVLNSSAAVVQPTTYVPSAVAVTGGTVNGTSVGATTPSTVAATTLTASAAITLSPANANVVLSPTGTGVVTINPATAGTVNNCSVGVTTPAVVKASDYQAARTDTSGAPGNATINTPRGRAAIAAAASTCVITNSLVTATSTVLVQLGGADATASTCRVTAAAGSFTVTANGAATGTTPFDFIVVN